MGRSVGRSTVHVSQMSLKLIVARHFANKPQLASVLQKVIILLDDIGRCETWPVNVRATQGSAS